MWKDWVICRPNQQYRLPIMSPVARMNIRQYCHRKTNRVPEPCIVVPNLNGGLPGCPFIYQGVHWIHLEISLGRKAPKFARVGRGERTEFLKAWQRSTSHLSVVWFGPESVVWPGRGFPSVHSQGVRSYQSKTESCLKEVL